MNKYEVHPRSEKLGIDDLQTDFLSLRVGEEIPQMQIKEIRKVINSNRDDNLSGVDYKFIIETTDSKVLRITSWILWKKIAAAIQEAGSLSITLMIKHPAVGEYSVEVIQQ